MADLIPRAYIREALGHFNDCVNGDPHFLNGIETAKEITENAPAVDAAPVVRCRDCKHGTPTKNARGEVVIKCEEICWLCRLPRLMELDWFCADGERRDDDALSGR